MTFNTQHCLNYITQKIDFDIMAKTILDYDPDIVGLNEMRGVGVDPEYTNQVETLAEKTGMKYFYFAPAIDLSGHGLYGNGFLSKRPILKAENIPVPDPFPKKFNTHRYETRCLLKAELEDGITVLVTHFGLNEDEQENSVKTVLENIPDKKVILMGDFNVSPNSPIIASIKNKLYDTALMFTEEKLSFPSDAPYIKIDYIFVSHDINVLEADIPAVIASDHRPHTATVEL